MGAPAAMTPTAIHRFVGTDIVVEFAELSEAVSIGDVNGTSLRRVCSLLGVATLRTDDNADRRRKAVAAVVERCEEWESIMFKDLDRFGSEQDDDDSEYDPHAEADEAEADASRGDTPADTPASGEPDKDGDVEAEAEADSEGEGGAVGGGGEPPAPEFVVITNGVPSTLSVDEVRILVGADRSDPNGVPPVDPDLPHGWNPREGAPDVPSGADDSEHSTHESLPRVLAHLAAGNHVFLYGPKGSGKSTAYETYAKIAGMGYEAVACHPHMTASSLVGYRTPNGPWIDGSLSKSLREDLLLGVDEIDMGTPGMLSVLNMATAQGVINADEMLRATDRWRVIATANTNGQGATLEYVGRNKMDEALLDRFSMIHWDTDTKLERYIVRRVGWHDPAQGEELLSAVAMARANIDSYGLRCTLSMRSTIAMAKQLAAMQSPKWQESGLPTLSLREVFTDRVGNKLSPDLSEKLTAGLF
jgi:energy-coupling factor transporter ATP-binding protein EcfA2